MIRYALFEPLRLDMDPLTAEQAAGLRNAENPPFSSLENRPPPWKISFHMMQEE